MFPLCKTCADACNQFPCTHNDSERAIQGTWCSVELEKALAWPEISDMFDGACAKFAAKNGYPAPMS